MLSLTVRRCLIAAAFTLAFSGLVAPAFAQQTGRVDRAYYISFQVSDCQSTSPVSISTLLSVTGSAGSCSASCSFGFPAPLCNTHGFVRNIFGEVSIFDPPGSLNTSPAGINVAGAVAGSFHDSVSSHGFLRSPKGAITVFDFSGATATSVVGINTSGAIAGVWYGGSNGPSHGFVRSPEGKMTSFDPPGSTGTFVGGINDEGSVAGGYTNGSGGHGFIRNSNGEFTYFEVPGGTPPPILIVGPGFDINAEGTVTGLYSDHSDGIPTHGFVRSRQGAITTFDPPGSEGTGPRSINVAGTITGNFQDSAGSHGFVRNGQGTFAVFDYPNGTNTTGTSINDLGIITGSYSNSAGVPLGFIRIPFPGSE
jgi:hypothetical protein